MHEGEVISILFLGAVLGIATTLLIQWYGRRKVKVRPPAKIGRDA